ncbi:unnamed protein product [Zymoseptoria tritici ST99CH_1A5]|uniref:Zn(2)-C6 fungal-type domain-containing protein n=1 Tax=Zymoseptoria tritici ST99CH_1A5 TaxID=1276529 RepID=A0A1Y6LXT0_ZYMTR|nr:unnamed protein product [Zymoseptoria tritici ST99CH_1A5]
MAGAQPGTGDVQLAMQRPINRLPVRKLSKDSKETMNCKSCRKRKIKCNRMKPSCEACQVFNCACIYDAIPKKRGPKTDVLEALLKRVNGLEARLKEEQKSSSPEAESAGSANEGYETGPNAEFKFERRNTAPQPALSESANIRSWVQETAPPQQEQIAFTNALLDTYFARLHNKPFYVLDESATRARFRDGRLPVFLVNALHAVTSRVVPHLFGGYQAAIQFSQLHADRSRSQIDVDEPNVENLQALLLLATAYYQNGKGKKSQMVLNHAISMAYALNLHIELPEDLRIASSEREGRRKLFWTCYAMDRFQVTGSKRPALIGDESIHLRLPAWRPLGSQNVIDGDFFSSRSSMSHSSGASGAAQGIGRMLVEIVRILGVTNRYILAGGVKGDSHFPWNAQSTLSRIRAALDGWSAATQDVFASINNLLTSPDGSSIVLSKLIYHLVHCLIYRPFLPIDLAELNGTGQNQSWQIEATNICFHHANAIAELVQMGRNSALLDWPSFVGYCIATAGTIHIHGVHYMSYHPNELYYKSADYLSRSMDQLLELRTIWAGVQHQRDTLQLAYASHAELVKNLSSSSTRYTPVFQMEDFFDRYRGAPIDGSYVTFFDIVIADDSLFETSSRRDSDRYPDEANQRPTTASYPSSHILHTAKKIRSASTNTLPYPSPRSTIRASIESHPSSYDRPAISNFSYSSASTENVDYATALVQHHSHSLPNVQTGSSNTNDLADHHFNDFHFSNDFSLQQSGSTGRGAGAGDTSSVEEAEEDPFLTLLGTLGEGDLGVLGSAQTMDHEGMEFDWGME